ncbi:MAG TPA: hypothetical protein VM821_02290 [Abditibacteriaceae bacterium]|nr:hypothetical protein [Abditibacteriaceae bacterium]
MNLTATLANRQQVLVENEEGQTRITLHSGEEGKKQSQSNSFQTGEWSETPTLYKTKDGFVLQVEAAQGRFSFRLQNNAIDQLDAAPTLDDAQQMSFEKASAEDVAQSRPELMKPMKPMQPLKPM